jgi:hypothetical protein
MRTFAAFAFLAALVSVPARAQQPAQGRLGSPNCQDPGASRPSQAPLCGQVPEKLSLNFDAIAKNATEKTELTLEGPMLDILKQTVLKASGQDPALFAAVDQISVHSYEFAKPGDYSNSDLDPLRKQLASSPGWSRVLNAKEHGEDTQIYVFIQGDKPSGFLLISAKPEEVNVIHVSGSIQLAQLKELIDSTIRFKDQAQQ